MRIGIVDADLIGAGTRIPNLALMKLSSFRKSMGDDTELVLRWEQAHDYPLLFVSKVFAKTPVPSWVMSDSPFIVKGGTGFSETGDPDLPVQIEHCMPDYHLYDRYLATFTNHPSYLSHYTDYSIGFMTRGCFRKCPFCVNKKYDQAFLHSPLAEFYDPERPFIMLLDDNILSYSGWEMVFSSLERTGRRFNFKQGLDIRLLTDRKAEVLSKANYIGDFIFAFDDVRDEQLIEEKLALWRKYSQRSTKAYVLCAYYSVGIFDIAGIFERLRILARYNVLPFLMRYSETDMGEFAGIYNTLARWCNQAAIFRKTSFREFCTIVSARDRKTDLLRFKEFESRYPSVAAEYFDVKITNNEAQPPGYPVV